MKLTRSILLLLASFFAPAAFAADPAPVKVEGAFIAAVPPGSGATAAFMTIVNPTGQPVRLVGGECEVAGVCEPMITTVEKKDGRDVHGMKTVPELEVPAAGRRLLKPRGDHLMLMSLRRVPRAGETLKLTLRFEPGAREVVVQAPVKAIDAK